MKRLSVRPGGGMVFLILLIAFALVGALAPKPAAAAGASSIAVYESDVYDPLYLYENYRLYFAVDVSNLQSGDTVSAFVVGNSWATGARMWDGTEGDKGPFYDLYNLPEAWAGAVASYAGDVWSWNDGASDHVLDYVPASWADQGITKAFLFYAYTAGGGLPLSLDAGPAGGGYKGFVGLVEGGPASPFVAVITGVTGGNSFYESETTSGPSAVPEPATLLLLLGGLLPLGIAGRRKGRG